MNKPLPRRAKEYFEVLDSLRAQGFVTHEEWLNLIPKEQASIPKMTARVIEDALIEHNYSKGCSNEQKKYRTLWLEERGIGSDSKEIVARTSDPILGAVEVFRTQLRKEEKKRADREIEKAVSKAQQAIESYNRVIIELKDKMTQFDSLQQAHLKLNHDHQKLSDERQHVKQLLANTEIKLEANEKNFRDKAKKQKEHHEEIMELNKQTIKHLRADLVSLNEKQVTEIKAIKQSSEDLRHRLVVEIEGLKEANKKSDRENHRLVGANQQCQETIKDLRNQAKTLQSEKTRLQNELKTANTNLHEAVKRHVALSTKLREMEEKCSTQRKDFDKVQNALLMEKEKSGNLEGQLQILVNHEQKPKKLNARTKK